MPTTMLKQLSSQYIAPVLKSAGFTKHRLIWNRRIDRLVHVIDVEEARWSGEDKSLFGISIGVAVAEVYRIVWGKELPSVFRESDCLPRFPYGYLPGVDAGRDIGWELCDCGEIEQVGPEVMRAIKEKCLPFFDRFRTIHDVQNLANRADQLRYPAEKLKFAVLSRLAGDEKSCEAVFESLETDPGVWEARISGTRTRLREYLVASQNSSEGMSGEKKDEETE